MEWDDLEAVDIGEEGMSLPDPRLPPEEEGASPIERVFSRLGLVFALLCMASFAGTVVLLNWDTWVRGAAEDSIGDTQRLLIYAGAVVTTVFAVLSMVDILRGQPHPAASVEERA